MLAWTIANPPITSFYLTVSSGRTGFSHLGHCFFIGCFDQFSTTSQTVLHKWESGLQIILMFRPLCCLPTGTMERAADGEEEQGGEEVAPNQEASRDPQGLSHLADSPAPQQVCRSRFFLFCLLFILVLDQKWWHMISVCDAVWPPGYRWIWPAAAWPRWHRYRHTSWLVFVNGQRRWRCTINECLC